MRSKPPVTVNVGGSAESTQQLGSIVELLEKLHRDLLDGLEKLRGEQARLSFAVQGIWERETHYLEELLKLDRQLGRTRGRQRKARVEVL